MIHNIPAGCGSATAGWAGIQVKKTEFIARVKWIQRISSFFEEVVIPDNAKVDVVHVLILTLIF